MTASGCLALIPAAHTRWLQEAEWAGVGETMFSATALALLIAIVLAPALQWAYSRRMQRFMSMREVRDAPLRWWRVAPRPARDPAASAPVDAAALAEAAARREQRVRRASWAAYAAFVAGGLATLPLHLQDSRLLLASVYVALMGLGPTLANVRPQGRSWWIWLPALAVAGMAMLEERADWTEGLSTALAILLVSIASVHRTLRAVVGPAMVVLCAGTLGLMAGFWVADVPLKVCAPGFVADTAGTMQQGVVLAAFAVPCVAGAWAGVAALPLVARGIERRWMSDLSLVALFGLVFVAGLMSASAEGDRATPVVAFLAFAGWIALTVGTYAIVLARQPCPAVARTLLVLRVFSHDGRTERMLDGLQSRWRYAGPVIEIGGPDLAKLNLDLDEFIKFLTLRQHELLTPNSITEAEFVASLDLGMDREGRFRIDEVFCFDSSWKTMVERLMRASDAILLDLRGFSAQRGGTTHEVVRLASLGLLPRVVTLFDAGTDWRHFDAQVSAQAPAAKIDAKDGDAQEQCWSALLASAGRAR